MKREIKGILEIDSRGVIYFHSEETGTSFLRICKLPITATHPNYIKSIDITHMYGVNVEEVPFEDRCNCGHIEDVHKMKEDDYNPCGESGCDCLRFSIE